MGAHIVLKTKAGEVSLIKIRVDFDAQIQLNYTIKKGFRLLKL